MQPIDVATSHHGLLVAAQGMMIIPFLFMSYRSHLSVLNLMFAGYRQGLCIHLQVSSMFICK
jgi:hypothetical protein